MPVSEKSGIETNIAFYFMVMVIDDLRKYSTIGWHTQLGQHTEEFHAV